jgi:hypothetical protein
VRLYPEGRLDSVIAENESRGPATQFPRQVAHFCGAALLVALLLATYGLDLSAGFF